MSHNHCVVLEKGGLGSTAFLAGVSFLPLELLMLAWH